MRFLILLLALAIPGFAYADDATVFPPENCSKEEYRIITWQDGSTSTVCRSPQEIFHLALPDCHDGEVIVFRDGSSDGGSGRVPVGMTGKQDWGQFVCEAKSSFDLTINIAINTSYTATADGFLFVHVWAQPGDTAARAPIYQVLINGNMLTYVMAQDNYVTGTFSISHNNLTYPVHKGETVRIVTVSPGGGAEARFVAFK